MYIKIWSLIMGMHDMSAQDAIVQKFKIQEKENPKVEIEKIFSCKYKSLKGPICNKYIINY